MIQSSGLHNKKFDVIIVGAGVGGLICGCYLSAAGLKVLIVEQHDKPGGYCTSFIKQNYQFDVGVHFLGSLRKGVLSKIANEIDFLKHVNVDHFDPVEKIIMGNNEVLIRSDFHQTIKEFKKCFPSEAGNIDRFFNFIMQENFYSNIYPKVFDRSFQDVLAEFFGDYRTKALIGAISLWNIGSNPSQSMALPSIALMREYILDAGAYPRGGIQAFPNSLVAYIKEKKGSCVFSCKVKRFLVSDNKIAGVILDNNEVVFSSVVVSNVDAYTTFKKFLDIQNEESLILKNLTPSPSMFSVYIGLKQRLASEYKSIPNTLYFSNYRINEKLFDIRRIISTGNLQYLVSAFSCSHDKTKDPEKQSTLSLYMLANAESFDFWEKNKNLITKMMIAKASKLFPGLSDSINVVISATPKSFFNMTSNFGGAYIGWLAQRNLSRKYKIRQRTSIPGLYCAGHWYTGEFLSCGGVPIVSFSGRRAAKLILEDLNLPWGYSNISL